MGDVPEYDFWTTLSESGLKHNFRFARQPEGTPQQEPLRLGNAEANLSAQVLHRVKNR